jgi:hypothetical protein
MWKLHMIWKTQSFEMDFLCTNWQTNNNFLFLYSLLKIVIFYKWLLVFHVGFLYCNVSSNRKYIYIYFLLFVKTIQTFCFDQMYVFMNYWVEVWGMVSLCSLLHSTFQATRPSCIQWLYTPFDPFHVTALVISQLFILIQRRKDTKQSPMTMHLWSHCIIIFAACLVSNYKDMIKGFHSQYLWSGKITPLFWYWASLYTLPGADSHLLCLFCFSGKSSLLGYQQFINCNTG